MKSNETQWRRQATRQHGAISHGQLLDAGLSRRQVDLRLLGGELERLLRGVFRVVGTPATFEQSLMAACLATGGVASHRAAAALWNLRGCEPGTVELTVVGRRRPELPGVLAHTTAQLTATDRSERMFIPVTTPARTLLDLGAVLPEEAVESALEDALHRGLVTEQWLERTLQRRGRPGRDGTGVLRGLLAARQPGQAPTESPLEDAIVRLLRRAGLPEPVRQHAVRGPGGRLVRIDLCYPEARLAIEAQSLIWHGGRAALQADCDKHNLLVSLGWRILVFTWADAKRRGPQLVQAVRHGLFGVETTFGVQTTFHVASTPQRW